MTTLLQTPADTDLESDCQSMRPRQLDWLIIGGGIHGVHVAARLRGEAGVAPEQLRIIDPGDCLLERWRRCTAATGMTHLRSPSVHNLDLERGSLRRFARTQTRVRGKSREERKRQRDRKYGLAFAQPHNRPDLDLFNNHCDKVVKWFGLAALHVRDWAVHCSVGCDSVGVQLSDGRKLTAANLVLAIGASEQPAWPDWAPRHHPRVRHIFEPAFDGWPPSRETVVVVGGGISAGQAALRLRKEGHEVHLVSRHPLREHHFDSDPRWVGPRLMDGFHREHDYGRRRAMITEARHRGSVPPEVGTAIRRAVARQRLHWHEAEVVDLDHGEGDLQIRLSSSVRLNAQRVLLATGFTLERPGGAMVDELVASASLPCASCGYPIVDSALRWHPRVYVTGPLAELELGPTSRNIIGARRAGDRLINAVGARTSFNTW